jgi:hypothetical protein
MMLRPEGRAFGAISESYARRSPAHVAHRRRHPAIAMNPDKPVRSNRFGAIFMVVD